MNQQSQKVYIPLRAERSQQKIQNMIKKLFIKTLHTFIKDRYNEKNRLYRKAKRCFKYAQTVSPATLQRFLHIDYSIARDILDRMIAEGFCKEVGGSLPCPRII